MKKKVLRPWTMALCVLALVPMHAQVSTPFNNGGIGDFVGWDNTNGFPLEIRHDANQPIDWYTDSIQRMRLHPTQTTNLPLIGGGTIPVQQDGFLAISGTPALLAPGGRGAFTRLHLADIDPSSSANFYAQPWGYRGWMRNGMTLTGNRDQAYVGQLYHDEDESDMVIQWSDNSDKQPTIGPDRMRFLFTWNRVQGITEGAQSEEGLELMRLYPEDSFEGFVGIGNYARPGLLEPEPTERLDVLDRTVRIRQLPDDYEDSTKVMDKVVVVDDDGRLHWRPETDYIDPAATDCDWETSAGQVYTSWRAAGTNGTCPEEDNNVGIGTNIPTAKLHVKKTVAGSPSNHAGMFEVQGTTGNNAGLRGTATGSLALENYGVQGRGYNATSKNFGMHAWGIMDGTNTTDTNHGIFGLAQVGSNASSNHNFGVKAQAEANGSTTNNYGVYTWARGAGAATSYGIWARATQAPQNWAGYFQGKVMITDSAWVLGTQLVTSDAGLKQNIQDVQDALSLLSQLAPKTYEFDPGTLPQATLPGGPQIGLVAQEVEAVMPEVVGSTIVPAGLDSLGNVVHPARNIKGIDYMKLIPLLIAGVQEQQAQIAELQQDLAACCAATGGDVDTRNLTEGQAGMPTSLENDRLTIAPNPFQERTTLSYLLEAPARVRLQVHTEGGMHLATLRDQPQEPGSYSMTWDTQDLAPGLYYVSLFADGKPVVKKAVKVR